MSDATPSSSHTVWPPFLLALMLAMGAIFAPWPLIGARPDRQLAGVDSVGVRMTTGWTCNSWPARCSPSCPAFPD